MSEGIAAITEVMTFFEGNSTLSVLLGIAVAGVGISLVMSIFFRK